VNSRQYKSLDEFIKQAWKIQEGFRFFHYQTNYTNDCSLQSSWDALTGNIISLLKLSHNIYSPFKFTDRGLLLSPKSECKNIGNFTTLLKPHNIGTHLKGIETSFLVVPLFLTFGRVISLLEFSQNTFSL
jgi:hypothetical protein